MKFIPLRLFRYLYPVDIQKHINTHFEETLKELTAENSDYHRQIIQLGNQIIQLAGELEATKQELEESKRIANQLDANVLHLTEGLARAHREAARVFFAAIAKLGHEHLVMSSKKPKG
jgi:uncharacterized coiled-coil DUF342 family protein